MCNVRLKTLLRNLFNFFDPEFQLGNKPDHKCHIVIILKAIKNL